jgi:hypothetical protein
VHDVESFALAGKGNLSGLGGVDVWLHMLRILQESAKRMLFKAKIVPFFGQARIGHQKMLYF